MTTQFKLAAALILSGMIVAGCSRPAETTEPASAAQAPATSPDVHRFTVGALQAVALKDGEMALDNAAGQSPWADTAGVTEVLSQTGDPKIHLSIQPLLIQGEDKVVLIDTGAGGQMGTQNKLPASLAAAGIQPGAVTDILISHGHGDHVGGLVTNGALTYPNAAIRMSADEWAAIQGDAELAALVPIITPRVETFEAGAQVTPSITAVSLQGHTAGHTGYEIVSGQDRLLYIGDALHSSIISVQRPEFVNGWDYDSDAAIATRLALLGRGATQNLRIYGVHFPFPGLGKFQRQADGFVWVPETPAQP
ncbi:MAG: MBL fold metallo-hydrolase [Alphaproteobacteria bacterium]|nr:MBL fold metallo-hydrolase [Alphaproteobacteria bacterium]MBU2379156.1 MBL fold metallo-hydrolase [Alphaproteobacteria bacterium]